MINLSLGSYDRLYSIFNQIYPMPTPEVQIYGFLKTFKDLPTNVKNFMKNLTERITNNILDDNKFVLTTSALTMMYFILIGIPVKKKKIFIEKPTYPRFYSMVEYLNKTYPDDFIMVDNPEEANVEYIIYPNNPDGQLFEPKTLNNKLSYIIYDTVYLYPHYFINTREYNNAIKIINKQIANIITMNKDFMIIQNLSQMSSCLGYRMSWCYISNPSLFNIIKKWTMLTNGVSSIVANIFNQQLEVIDWDLLFNNFRKITIKRTKKFKKVFSIISTKTDIKLLSTVPFLLIYDPGLKLYNYLLSNNIIVLIGSELGLSNDFIRIPFYMNDIYYNILIDSLNSFSVIS